MTSDFSKYMPVVSSDKLDTNCHDCDEVLREDLTFTPELMYFDYIMPNGVSDPQPLTIQNTGDLPVSLAGFQISGDFQYQGEVPEQLTVGESFTLTVTFTPTEDGARLGEIITDGVTTGPVTRVKLIGIGGNSALQLAMSTMQSQMAALQAQLNTAVSQIAMLQNEIDNFEFGNVRYTWRAYAKSPDGSVDFTTGTPTINHTYIGLAFNKETSIPSQNFADYTWSRISAVEANFISQDTINVGGVPAWQLVTDLSSLAYQIMAYQFDRQTLLDYVNEALFLDGVAVKTVISQEQIQRQNADSAMAGTLALIGAKTLDGSAFILDMNKVMVTPTMSLSTRISNVAAQAANAEAQIQNLEEAVATANYAAASDLALLGAKTLDGTAFVMDLSTVRVSAEQTLAQHINTAVAAAAGEAASVTELFETLVTPTGGASAKALLQLDVNGHVVGQVATNDGDFGQIVFNFDSFIIRHPGTTNPVFEAVGGVVKMHNVEIDTLKVGSVVAESLASGAVQKVHYAKSSAITICPKNTWKTVFTITFNKLDDESLLEAVMFGVFQTTDDLIYDAHFLIDGVTQTPNQRVNLVLTGNGTMGGLDKEAGGSSSMTPWAFIEDLPKGMHSIAFRVMNREPDNYAGNGNMNILAGAVLKVTEMRRATM